MSAPTRCSPESESQTYVEKQELMGVLPSETEVSDTLRKLREAAVLGELDALIEQQAQFGRRLR